MRHMQHHTPAALNKIDHRLRVLPADHTLANFLFHPSPRPVDFFLRCNSFDFFFLGHRGHPAVAVEQAHKFTKNLRQSLLIKGIVEHGLGHLNHLLINFIVFTITLLKANRVFRHLIKQSSYRVIFLLQNQRFFERHFKHWNLTAIDHLLHLRRHHHGLAKAGKNILHHLKHRGVIAVQATAPLTLLKLFNRRRQIAGNLTIAGQLSTVSNQIVNLLVNLGK